MQALSDAQLSDGARPQLRAACRRLTRNATDTAVLHFLVSAMKRKLQKLSDITQPSQHESGGASIAHTAASAVAPTSRRNSRDAKLPPQTKSSDAESAARLLQQRADVLQAQLAMAEVAVRDAAQQQAALRKVCEAAQAEITSLKEALAAQAREHASQCQAMEEQQRSAAQNFSSVISCASLSLRQLACAHPRIFHTQQVQP